MDEIRDTQKNEGLSRFIDGPLIKTNPFGGNRAGERAYRRAERIAAALHLLTNHIDAAEPIRNSIRKEAVALLDAALGIRDEMRATHSGNIQLFEGRIRNLISLVRILTMSGFVSMQNASTMIEALDDLGVFLQNSQRSTLAESVTFSKEDLMDVAGVHSARAARPIRDIKDTVSIKDSTEQSDNMHASHRASINNGQESIRAAQILGVLQSGGAYGIRDIAENLPEYSEKMIQRELSDLVLRGRVNKAGDKRWSRYSLAR